MRRIIITFLLCLVYVSVAVSATAQQVKVETNGITTMVEFFSSDIVRVVKYPSAKGLPTRESLVVMLKAQPNLQIRVKETPAKATLSSATLTVVVDKKSGLVQFLSKGKNMLKEKSFGFEERTSGPDTGSYRTTIVYTLDKEEPIYGLGAIQDGQLNRRNSTHRMMEQSNLQDYQYVVQSIKGWGLYWDNYSRADFEDNQDGMKFSAEVGDAIDYYFMLGGSADGVNTRVRELSGQVPMFPLWTFGYWQCRERYKTTEELLEVVRWHRQNGVPLDGIVQDWQYWGNNYLWNAMDFLSESYVRGKEMVDEVHSLNAHLMISIWASFGPQTHAFKQLEERGLLYDFSTWPQSGLSHIWPPRMDYPSGVRVYDALSPEARDIYWQNLKKLVDYDIDAWWMDSTDPDFFSPQDSHYDHSAGDGTWRRYRNAFPLASVSGVYDNLRKNSETKRVFIMTRSAFAGQQRYGSGLWSGDVASSWDMLRKQLPLGLNYTMTGCPNFNTDIGGFFCNAYNTKGGGSAPQNKQYQELYVRWMQYALFCPVFRSHGADAPREIYRFGSKGDAAYDAIEKCIRLRYQLLPYIYSTAWQVTNNNESYLRALVYDFAADKAVWNMTDEFMFGRSILATPIVAPQYTEEKVFREDAMSGWDKNKTTEESAGKVDFGVRKSVTKYLPKGADWYNFWTEEFYKGGRQVIIETQFDEGPMFVKAGTILPLAPVMQYAEESKWDNLDIIVYPGADATFTLYEDEGDNYNYEKGVYSTIEFRWNDKNKQLIIDDVKGEYPGMLTKRKFNVRIVGNKEVKEVEYTGKKIVM
jgi:alpha-D-xyloside xylohydrolase